MCPFMTIPSVSHLIIYQSWYCLHISGPSSLLPHWHRWITILLLYFLYIKRITRADHGCRCSDFSGEMWIGINNLKQVERILQHGQGRASKKQKRRCSWIHWSSRETRSFTFWGPVWYISSTTNNTCTQLTLVGMLVPTSATRTMALKWYTSHWLNQVTHVGLSSKRLQRPHARHIGSSSLCTDNAQFWANFLLLDIKSAINV